MERLDLASEQFAFGLDFEIDPCWWNLGLARVPIVPVLATDPPAIDCLGPENCLAIDSDLMFDETEPLMVE